MLIYLLLLLPFRGLFAQNCVVRVDSLKGKYVGGCKYGKADGKGTANGTDTYTGDFRDGLPDGHGRYEWKNGDWYDGSWKNGKFDGVGTLSKSGRNQSDSGSLLTGFWKKGKYIGQYEKPYIIQPMTNNINDVSVRKLPGRDPEITITIKSTTGGASSLYHPLLPKPKLISVETITGKFQQEVDDETGSMITNKYTFRQVIFPFFAVFTFQTEGSKLPVDKLNVQINEASHWSIQVSVDN